MAERRMFAKTIIDSDAFLEMPLSTQSLYFHLAMRADDEGFINNPKKIQRMVGASEDDLKLLCAKGFIIPFDSGVVVIKHWRIHNYLQKDRIKPTVYEDEKAMLTIKNNRAYSLSDGLKVLPEPVAATDGKGDVYSMDTECIQNVYGLDSQNSIDKNRVDKNRLDKREGTRSRFVRPTLDEVSDYIKEQKYDVDAEKFIDYYESVGWTVGRNKPMKDWKAAVRTWAKTEKTRLMYDKAKQRNEIKKNSFNDYPQREYDFNDLEMKLFNKLHGKEGTE